MKKAATKQRSKGMKVAAWTNSRQRELGKPWERIQKAYLEKKLTDGQILKIVELKKICGLNASGIDNVQMDLVEHRAPLRLISYGPGRVRVRAA